MEINVKVAFLGNFSDEHGSETYHKRSLEALGHTVTPFQETQAGSELILQEALKSDMFVWVHTQGWQTPGALGMSEVLSTLKRVGIPSVAYHLDLLFGLQRQSDLGENDVFYHIDHFFTVDRRMAEWFNSNTDVKGHYLQAGVSYDECIMTPPAKPEYQHDVIFVGSKGYHPEWPYRPLLIDWLKDTYNDRFAHYGGDGLGVMRGLPLNSLYADSKIVIGDSLCREFTYEDYWSDRVYETIGRGGFIIHPFIEGMEKHFEDREHLVFYEFGNFDQLAELVAYYLEHSTEREQIRRSGHEHVKEHHTYVNRWRHIVEQVTLS